MDDPYDPEKPFVYECFDCERRFEPDDRSDLTEDDELIACPHCGGELRNLSTPDKE